MSNSKAIRYDVIVQEAMLGVVKKVLTDAQNDGLHNDHHFYLTYSTCYEGVEIPSSLLSKYPDEITIVLQHEYENLVVYEEHFCVTLWFNNVPAHLRVPFKAIKAFFDPSVKFGLQFNVLEQEELENDLQPISAEVTPLDIHQASSQKEKSKADGKKTAKDTKKSDNTSSDKKNISDAQNKKSTTDDKNAKVISLDAFRKK